MRFSKKRKTIAFPSVCNCCLKHTFDSETREYTDLGLGGWEKQYTIDIPFCLDCKNHVKRNIFLGKLLKALGIIIFLALIIFGYSIKEGGANPILSVIIWIIIAVCSILFASIYFYRIKWQEKLISLGHGGAEETAILKEIYERKIRFCFKNREYASSFAEMNNSKIEL